MRVGLRQRDVFFTLLGLAAFVFGLQFALENPYINGGCSTPPTPREGYSDIPSLIDEFSFRSIYPTSVRDLYSVELSFYTYVYNKDTSFLVSVAPFGENAGEMPWIMNDIINGSCYARDTYAECPYPAITKSNYNQEKVFIEVPFQLTVHAGASYELAGLLQDGRKGLAILQISENGDVDLRREDEWTHGVLTSNTLRIVMPSNASSSLVNASRFHLEMQANITARIAYENSKVYTWFQGRNGHEGEVFTEFKVEGGNGNPVYNIPFSVDVEPDVIYELQSVMWTPYGRDRIDSVRFLVSGTPGQLGYVHINTN